MDDSVKLDPELEQLMRLKELSRNSGALHELQVLQLKYLPLITTHATSSEFIFKHDSREIIFNIKETQGKVPNKFKKRLKVLCQYAKNLLGSEYKVVVKLKGTVIFTDKARPEKRKLAKREEEDERDRSQQRRKKPSTKKRR